MAEKTISQIPRLVREQYEKGKSAFDRQNFDYAIAIFNQVLIQEPAFYDCREALRASQHKKSAGGSGFFKKMLSGAGSSPLLAKGQMVMMKQPVEALKIAEQILNNDPSSAAGHKLLGEAAMQADLPKTAILSLEIVVKNSPKDEDVKKSLARAYSAAGQGEKAERIFAELMRLHPNDLRLLDELKDISARKTLAEGGYEALSDGKGSYRDILKNKGEAVALEQEGRQVKSDDVAQRQINDLEARLLKEPNNLKLLRSVAELYDQKKDYDRALETYQRIISQEGSADASLQKEIAATTIRKLDLAITQLDPQAADTPEKAKQLQIERDQFLLADCEQRAERYPNDLGIRFELGKLYFQTGKITEAIREFQKAQNNPHKRIMSLSYLGQCFAQRNMNDMAARSLQNALKEKLVFDEEKKEIIYALGMVLEKMGKKEEAMDQFKQIYEVDSTFKDVAKKVEDHYSGGA
ncbi:MAG TPA: tetratricopeptide repeat protein [Candidatus Saccharimonadales bacterium]|nr:tetratricopeptide repeat protein [Candidatus Saccharimonadales bacterium]